MNKIPFLLIALVVMASSCEKKGEQNQENKDTATAAVDSSKMEKKPAGPELVLQWSTDTTLKTCESVLFDSANNILYVANINGGQPDTKDKDGFIARVSLDGKIDSLKWATGLSAPKGMALHNGKLYVTDITALVEIDPKTGKVGKRHEVAGAKFLNDAVAGPDGVIYFSDSYTNKIHELKNGKVSVFKQDNLNQPNGVYVLGNKLYLASMGSNDLKAIDITTKKDTVIATGIGAGDGVEYTGKEGQFIVSNWQGEVYLIEGDGKVQKLLDTKDQKLNAADIGFVKDKKVVFVPTFFGNKVQAYELKTE